MFAELKKVCYFPNWAQHREGAGKFTAEQIEVDRCTHIIYAFAHLKNNLLTPTEPSDESTMSKKGK